MKQLIFTFLFSLLTLVGVAQLTIQITNLPPNTPANSDIFIAGNFQNWNPGDDNFQLTINSNGIWSIIIDPAPGLLEYKFTRGSWNTVEGNANGGFIPNRTYQYDGNAATFSTTVEGWEDQDGGGSGGSTAAGNVTIWDDDYYIPQLNRNRRIWVYLPPDYDTSDKDYPVLYLHDGQNVFDASTAFSGEWEVDETLNQLHNEGDYGCIVVAIDNGGINRINEYCPWNNPDYGGGEGSDYIDFIVETLKPDIDDTFRTLTDRDHTAIGGSSLGALISSYGMASHPDVFGKAMCMSPAYWINPQIYQYVADAGEDGTTKKYLNAGITEGGGSVVGDVNGMEGALLAAGFDNTEIYKTFHADGAHSEWYWAREFEEGYEWLFSDLPVSNDITSLPATINIHPNPVGSEIYIDQFDTLQNPVLDLYNLEGKRIRHQILNHNTVDVSGLNGGTYIIQISEGKDVKLVEIVIFGN